MEQWTIGVDFGTLSARALLVNARTGEEVAEAVAPYAHGVMDQSLPCGAALPPDFALQHPRDYTEALRTVVRSVLSQSGIDPRGVVGLGVDFTTCTLLPLDADGTPLCFDPAWEREPLAYAILWKHHAAQSYADELTALAQKRGETWLGDYGNRISSEWTFPKIMQVAREAPALFRATARFSEAGDWIVRILTGAEVHSASFAGLKSFWSRKRGFPSPSFLREADPALDGIVGTKISPRVDDVASFAGRLNADGARLTGLPEGVAVSVPIADAHAAMPALGIADDGTLALILGTSLVHLVNCGEEKPVPGVCAHVTDGVIPGHTTYEAGQSGGGDIFDWFVHTQIPATYEREAAKKGISIHQLLREKVRALPAGASGLLALDWVNGCRSPYQNGDLSGVLLGLNLRTTPEEIYRAWIESTAYGTRRVLELYESGGIPVRDLCATGGIARKDPMLMQIFADVTGKPIRVGGAAQAAARGSAIYAAVVGGVYASLPEAIRALRVPDIGVYRPRPAETRVYNALYAEYRRLSVCLAEGENRVLEKLSAMRKRFSGEKNT